MIRYPRLEDRVRRLLRTKMTRPAEWSLGEVLEDFVETRYRKFIGRTRNDRVDQAR